MAAPVSPIAAIGRPTLVGVGAMAAGMARLGTRLLTWARAAGRR